jgi:hypothetical protein
VIFLTLATIDKECYPAINNDIRLHFPLHVVDLLQHNSQSIHNLMSEGVVELSAKTAAKVDEILSLLKDDEFRPGLISLVQSNAEQIAEMRRAQSYSTVSTTILIGVAWMGLFLVPALTILDRMILISEIRHSLGLYGWYAVAISTMVGLVAKGLLVFVVCIFTLRWLRWGRVD